MVSSDRFGSAARDDASGRSDTAGREGILTSNVQEVQETPNCIYIRTVRYATRGWQSAVLQIGVGMGIRLQSETVTVIRVSRLFFYTLDSSRHVSAMAFDCIWLNSSRCKLVI